MANYAPLLHARRIYPRKDVLALAHTRHVNPIEAHHHSTLRHALICRIGSWRHVRVFRWSDLCGNESLFDLDFPSEVEKKASTLLPLLKHCTLSCSDPTYLGAERVYIDGSTCTNFSAVLVIAARSGALTFRQNHQTSKTELRQHS